MCKRDVRLGVRIVIVLLLLQALCLASPLAGKGSRSGKLFGCGLNARAFSIGNYGRVVPARTGDYLLDNNINNDVTELRRVFNVSAPMFLYEETGSPNALAFSFVPAQISQLRIPAHLTRDGVVMIGVGLLREEATSSYRTGFGIPSVIAHEYAHILQYKMNFPLSGKWQELHADFMAGWYTGHRARHVPHNLYESMSSFYNHGDNDFTNPDHHGTPQERLEAFKAGVCLNLCYHVAFGSIAYEEGIKYLKQRGAR